MSFPMAVFLVTLWQNKCNTTRYNIIYIYYKFIMRWDNNNLLLYKTLKIDMLSGLVTI